MSNDEIQIDNNSNQILENKLKVDEKFEKEKIDYEKDSEKNEQENNEINTIINNKENELGINFSFNKKRINNFLFSKKKLIIYKLSRHLKII